MYPWRDGGANTASHIVFKGDRKAQSMPHTEQRSYRPNAISIFLYYMDLCHRNLILGEDKITIFLVDQSVPECIHASSNLQHRHARFFLLVLAAREVLNKIFTSLTRRKSGLSIIVAI